METLSLVDHGLIAERWGIVAFLVALPLIAGLRGARASHLFACAALCLAAVAAYGIASGGDQLGVRSALGLLLFTGFFTVLIFVQERFGGMVFPRITKALFWVAHIGAVVFYWMPLGHYLLADPLTTDLAASGDGVQRLILVNDIASSASLAAGAALVLAAPLSFVIAWRRRRA